MIRALLRLVLAALISALVGYLFDLSREQVELFTGGVILGSIATILDEMAVMLAYRSYKPPPTATLRAFQFLSDRESKWPDFKLVVYAPNKRVANRFVTDQAIGSLPHRHLAFIGEGEPAEMGKNSWAIARTHQA